MTSSRFPCSAAAEDIRRRSSGNVDWQNDGDVTVEAGSSLHPHNCIMIGERNRVVELQHVRHSHRETRLEENRARVAAADDGIEVLDV
jgi:hypothetical protein